MMAFLRRVFRKNNPGKPSDRAIEEQNAELLHESGMSSAKRMLINKGENDEMEIHGYRRNNLKTILTYISFLLTLGITRIVFHWFPHWYLYATSSMCPVTQAQSLLVIETFRMRKILHVCKMCVLTADDVFRFQQKEQDNIKIVNPELIEVLTQCAPSLSVNFGNGIFKNTDRLMTFSHKKVNYIWNPENRSFEKLTSLDVGVTGATLHNYQPLSEEEAFKRRAVYGSNVILIERNTIMGLLFEQVLGPYYIFQGFSLLLWFCDNYYYYAGAVLAISCYNILQSVFRTREYEKRLWETMHGTDMCEVQRQKRINRGTHSEEVITTTETVSTEYLEPGDILVIPAHGCTMHCDAVLLSGNCVVNEAMLTGESIPVTKTPIADEGDLVYDSKEHARHSLYSGTKVIQTRYDKGQVVAVVIRTGFSTAKGSLVRSILYPNPIDFKFEKDSYKYVFLTGFIALIAIAYEVCLKVARGFDPTVITLQALDVITISVPPALPSAMTAGYSNAQKRLKEEEIYCVAPRIINVAGSLNCVCFDKTGTLTEDGLDLYCVIPSCGSSFKPYITNVAELPYDTFFGGLVSCHSLTIINGEIVGDPLDLKMFESTGWHMKEPENEEDKYKPLVRASFEPPAGTTQELNGVEEIALLREFPFSSSLQRMGVISRTLNKKSFDYYCKGAPEMLLNFIDKKTLPKNFHEILEDYTQEGYRVIAIAHKEIFTKYSKIHKIQREELEDNLEFLGLIVLENRLKNETTQSINELKDADIRCIMVTGDNLLTAISVARDCDMLTPQVSVITINCDNSNPPNLYFTLNNVKPKNVPNGNIISNSASVVSLDTMESQLQSSWRYTDSKKPAINNNYRFALTGKVWEVIREYYSNDILGRVLTRGTVFARMGPDQKQQLVEELQKLGYFVGMCGDGANDCGALKAAHAGISLSDEESSLASPFNSKRPNISCVVKVIKEGRAALVSSFGIFKYMIFYSMNQLAGVINLAVSYTNFTDFQFLWMDLGITSPFALFFGTNKAFDGPMSKEPPLTSLICAQPIASLFIQLIVSIGFQLGLFAWMQEQEWYTPPVVSLDEDALPTYENYNVFITVCLQNIAMALVFSKGKPYRRIIFRNPRVMITTLVTLAITVYLAMEPVTMIQNLVGLKLPPDNMFKLFLMLFGLLSFFVAYIIEHYFIDELLARCTNKVDKTLKYVQIEEELNRNTNWPPLTSPEDFKATASPDNTIPDEPVDIVVEKDLELKNHILDPVVSDYTVMIEESKMHEKPAASVLTEVGKLVDLMGTTEIPSGLYRKGEAGNNLKLKTISENNLCKAGQFEDGRDRVTATTLNATPSRHPCPNNFQLSLAKSPAQSEDLFSSVPSNFNNISSGSDTFQSFSPSDEISPSSSSNFNIPDIPKDDTEKLWPHPNGFVNGFSSNEDIVGNS